MSQDAGGEPDAPRESPTHRFVNALLGKDPASIDPADASQPDVHDVEEVDANPPGGGPAAKEVEKQRPTLLQRAGTVATVSVVVGTAYAAFQWAAPLLNAIKREVCPFKQPASLRFVTLPVDVHAFDYAGLVLRA